MSGGRNIGVAIAAVAAVLLVVGVSMGYFTSASAAWPSSFQGGSDAAAGVPSTERDELLAMVKERDDTIKNLREKLEEAFEGRELDVSGGSNE